MTRPPQVTTPGGSGALAGQLIDPTARPATVGDLLEQAQRLAWDLPVTLPPPRSIVRVRTATREVRGHLGGWPALAEAATHCLANLPLTDVDRDASKPMAAALAHIGPTSRSAEMDPDPRMVRLAIVLGATGDLLASIRRPASVDPGSHSEPLRRKVSTGTMASSSGSRVSANPGIDTAVYPLFDPAIDEAARRDSLATMSKIASVLWSAAVTTISYIEVAPGTARPGGRWHTRLTRLSECAQSLTQIPAPQRSGRFDDLAATPVRPLEEGVPSGRARIPRRRSLDPAQGCARDVLTSFASWKDTTHRALSDRYPHSADFVQVAADLSLVLAAAARVFNDASLDSYDGLVDPAVATLARTTAVDAFGAWLRVHRTMRLATTGQGIDLDRAATSRRLQAALGTHFLGRDDSAPAHQATDSPPLQVDRPADRLPGLLSDMRVLLGGAAETASVLRVSVETAARRQEFLLPARVAIAAAYRPVPVEWVMAGRRSGWVRAPASLPPIHEIRDSIDQASDLTGAAALTGALTARLHHVRAGSPGHSAAFGRPAELYRFSVRTYERLAPDSRRHAIGPPAP